MGFSRQEYWSGVPLPSPIFYIENPKDTTRKLLELINKYSKVAGYKINTQKSLALLYTNNEKTEREIKETIPFTIATKRITFLGIYLPKKQKTYIYIENYKTLMKEIKDDTNRCRNMPSSRIRRITIVKRSVLPKAIYRCNPYTNGIFHRTRTNNFTICIEIHKTSNSQSNLLFFLFFYFLNFKIFNSYMRSQT